MAFVMPEIVVQRVIQKGIRELKQDDSAFDEIFGQMLESELIDDYGQSYIDQIRNWFKESKIPVLQSWTYNTNIIPCYSIHLSAEQEDEQKAAIGDYYSDGGDADETVHVGVFSVNIEIGIHASRNSDQTLWLYYIMAYILFKQKLTSVKLGVQLQTWSASEYSENRSYENDKVWSRWIRFRCVTENTLGNSAKITPEDVEVEVDYEKSTSETD
jgi:hypothetical protein